VVPSRQIKGLRTRYGSAGNKDDRFDAYVLADTLIDPLLVVLVSVRMLVQGRWPPGHCY
jgi:hypothetical protein